MFWIAKFEEQWSGCTGNTYRAYEARRCTIRKLNGVCSSFDLQLLITEATRVTETTETLLDHMYTNNIDKVNSSGHSVIHTGLSGHS